MKLRAVLQEYGIPDAAIRTAEQRVYPLRRLTDRPLEVHACEDGRCALGVMLHESGRLPGAAMPTFAEVGIALGLGSVLPRAVDVAITRIIYQNDAGTLAQAGRLTAILDEEVQG